MKMTWYLRAVPEGVVARGVCGRLAEDRSAAGSEVLVERGESFRGHSWTRLQELVLSPGYFVEGSDGKKTITVGGKEYAPDDRWEDAILEGLEAGLERAEEAREGGDDEGKGPE